MEYYRYNFAQLDTLGYQTLAENAFISMNLQDNTEAMIFIQLVHYVLETEHVCSLLYLFLKEPLYLVGSSLTAKQYQLMRIGMWNLKEDMDHIITFHMKQ